MPTKTEGQAAYERWANGKSPHGLCVTVAAPKWEQLPEATRAKWETPEFRAALKEA